MYKFIAILKDSFRETVDGFVIYVMLAMATLLLLLFATVSFTPRTGNEAVDVVASEFKTFVPDKGEAKDIGILPINISYKAAGYAESNNAVKCLLNVTTLDTFGPQGPNATAPPPERLKNLDFFPAVVAAWKHRPAEDETLRAKIRRMRQVGNESSKEEMERALRSMTGLTEESIRSVTKDDMCDYLANQFYMHGAIKGAKVTYVQQLEDKTHVFDVVLPNAKESLGWPTKVGVFFGATHFNWGSKGGMLYNLEDQTINGIGTGITLLISLIFTAFFIPNILRKGALDLIIAKPISRVGLLLSKYLGGCIFILILTIYTIGGTWLILSLRSGHWDPRFLVTIFTFTFTFALLYALSVLVAVLTRSAIASMLITIVFAGLLVLVGFAKARIDEINLLAPGEMAPWIPQVADGLNAALPRYNDLDRYCSRLTAESTLTPYEIHRRAIISEPPTLLGSIAISLDYIFIWLALACWRLVKRDG